MLLTPFAGPALLALAGILPAPTCVPMPPRAVATAVAAIHHDLTAGTLANRKGLEHSRNQGQAEQYFRTAATDFTRALAACRQLLQADLVLDEQVGPLQRDALRGRASALLNVAGLEMARTSLLAAFADVNQVLAEEPGNADALAMRRDIELVANHGCWDGVWLQTPGNAVVPAPKARAAR